MQRISFERTRKGRQCRPPGRRGELRQARGPSTTRRGGSGKAAATNGSGARKGLALPEVRRVVGLREPVRTRVRHGGQRMTTCEQRGSAGRQKCGE